MFRLKSKSSTADRGVPAQVGFNFNTDTVPANDIIIMILSLKGPFINLTSCFHMLNFVSIRGVVSFILIAAA